MIAKTIEQAKELAKKNGFVINYSDSIRCAEKCNCFAWWKFWNWFAKDTTQHYSAAEDSMVEGILNTITILICEKCGADEIKSPDHGTQD